MSYAAEVGSYSVVSLFECGLGNTFPTAGSVHGSLESNIEAAAINSKVEPGAFILNEMERDLSQDFGQLMTPGDQTSRAKNLWIPFLLQIHDNALTQGIGSPDDIKSSS